MYKLLYTKGKPGKGEYCVIIQRKGKIYKGIAHVHPEDQFSEIIGGSIAENKCNLHYYEEMLKQKKEEIKGVEKFIQHCKQCKNFDNESPTAKVMWRQYNVLLKEKEKIEKRIENIKLVITNIGNARANFRATQQKIINRRKALAELREKILAKTE